MISGESRKVRTLGLMPGTLLDYCFYWAFTDLGVQEEEGTWEANPMKMIRALRNRGSKSCQVRALSAL